MIIQTDGDLLQSPAFALVNPVNCVGVMGAGLAKQFRERYLHNYYMYRQACYRRQIKPGQMFVVLEEERCVINFPTKRHWLDPSTLDIVSLGLDALAMWLTANAIESVAIPALGCGHGGLDWSLVKPLIHERFEALPLTCYLFEPR